MTDEVILECRWAARTRRRDTIIESTRGWETRKEKKIPGKCPQLGFMCFLQELAASSEKKKKIKKKEKKKRN